MPVNNLIVAFLICGLAGFLLAVFELFKTFGRSIGRYWLTRYVVAVIVLNMVTAGVVYAILHFVLGIESTFWLAIVTGVTFPTILRSRFTFYRPLGKEAADTDSISLTLNTWYRDLQNLCYEEVNSRIAAERAAKVSRLRRCLTPARMNEYLSDHIESEVKLDSKKRHREQLREIKAMTEVKRRERRLAVLMMDIMPPPAIDAILKDCPK